MTKHRRGFLTQRDGKRASQESYLIGYSIRKEFSDTYFGTKIDKWTYWNQAGKQLAVIDYQIRRNRVLFDYSMVLSNQRVKGIYPLIGLYISKNLIAKVCR